MKLETSIELNKCERPACSLSDRFTPLGKPDKKRYQDAKEVGFLFRFSVGTSPKGEPKNANFIKTVPKL